MEHTRLPWYLQYWIVVDNHLAIHWMAMHRSRFNYWRWYCDIAIYVIVVCLMCVPCGNSLKILGNIYVRGSASWGVIEEDLSGASSARVRFSVGIAAAHVPFFEASYVRRSDVFSCKTLSLGKPSGQVHWYHWWPFAMPWPGHCCQWFDRTGCPHSRLLRERREACLSASQTQTMTNFWHCHRIPKGRKRHENIIWTWCSLPFPATSVLFLVRFTVSLNFWENSTTTITTTTITITTTTTITITITIIIIIIIIIITLFESPPFVLSPPWGSSH